MEVNSSPGLEGIEKTTGVDVAAKIIEHIEDQAVFVDVDIKQRLTLDKGYGIAEFQVHAKSDLAGKTLREAMLPEVRVLSIQRGGRNVPNPHAESRLEVGDVLLCYGALLPLKGLIPLDRWGRRRKTKRSTSMVPPADIEAAPLTPPAEELGPAVADADVGEPPPPTPRWVARAC
jgi:ribosomal protein S6--L-glutamate ligase